MSLSSKIVKNSSIITRKFSERPIQTQINAPFQTHLASATHRFREEHQQLSNNRTSLEPVIDEAKNNNINITEGDETKVKPGRLNRKPPQVYNFDETILNNNDIVAVGGRLIRHRNQEEKANQEIGGSVVASESATSRFRLQRQNADSIKLKNPSIISIPVTKKEITGEDSKAKDNEPNKSMKGGTVLGLMVGGGSTGAYYFDFIPHTI